MICSKTEVICSKTGLVAAKYASAMRPDDVTLSDAARRACSRVGVAEADVKSARAGSVSITESPEWLIVYGELPDGRRARMACPHHIPNHIVSWRPAQND